eukprot:gb/GECG01012447.1/.p1 GENE.gb/GECG01012447.1/~~gb/GECG01012447.1/.p1  ORF type:complete len:140 (+),score=9.76 gb/GECG01012447.1/:1-420(+)
MASNRNVEKGAASACCGVHRGCIGTNDCSYHHTFCFIHFIEYDETLSGSNRKLRGAVQVVCQCWISMGRNGSFRWNESSSSTSIFIRRRKLASDSGPLYQYDSPGNGDRSGFLSYAGSCYLLVFDTLVASSFKVQSQPL